MQRTGHTSRGFTLVELLVVIIVISILLAMLTIGFRVVSNSGRTSATTTMLQNARSLTDPFVNRAVSNSQVNFAGLMAGQVPAPGDVTSNSATANTWFIAADSTNASRDFPQYPTTSGMDVCSDRLGSVASMYAGELLALANSDPTAKATIARLPNNQVLPVTVPINIWRVGATYRKASSPFIAYINAAATGQNYIYWYELNNDTHAVSSPPNDTTDYTPISSTTPTAAWNSATTYSPGAFVTYNSNLYYVASSPTAGSLPSAPGSGFVQLTEQSVLLLDGWQNPLIFVPSVSLPVILPQTAPPPPIAGGLADVTPANATSATSTFNSATTYTAGSVMSYPSNGSEYYYTFFEGSGSGITPLASNLNDPDWFQGIIPPNDHPAWASAGPDGNFITNDDNIYSYGQ